MDLSQRVWQKVKLTGEEGGAGIGHTIVLLQLVTECPSLAWDCWREYVADGVGTSQVDVKFWGGVGPTKREINPVRNSGGLGGRCWSVSPSHEGGWPSSFHF